MTKQEIMETEFKHIKNFDYALSQDVLNEMNKVLNEDNVSGHFITSYDDGNVFGRIFPITEKGKKLLARYEEIMYKLMG